MKNYFFIISAPEEAHPYIKEHIHKLMNNPRVDCIKSSTNFNDIAGSLIKGPHKLLDEKSWDCIARPGEELTADIHELIIKPSAQPVTTTIEENKLFKHLRKDNREHNSILLSMISASEYEHIQLAIKAMNEGHSNKSIIYLMGGNNPTTNPFAPKTHELELIVDEETGQRTSSVHPLDLTPA